MEHKKYNLYGELALEKMELQAPFKKLNSMPNSACFLYVVNGYLNLYSHAELSLVGKKEALLLKCGNYIAKLENLESDEKQVIVAIHFHPTILKKIYQNDLPEFLKNPAKSYNNTTVNLINSDKLTEKYNEYSSSDKFINVCFIAVKTLK